MFESATAVGPEEYSSTPVRWSFIASVVLTGTMAALVCGPPFHPLRSWKELLLLAFSYLLLAAAAHVAAIFCVFRLPEAYRRVFQWRTTLKLAAGAWMAVAWLPLIAVLTSENSFWIAFVLPVAVVWATVFFSMQETGRDVPLEFPSKPPEALFAGLPTETKSRSGVYCCQSFVWHWR